MIEWNKIDEELPKDCNEVLVCTNFGYIQKGLFNKKKWSMGQFFQQKYGRGKFYLTKGREYFTAGLKFEHKKILGQNFDFAYLHKDDGFEFITHWAYIKNPSEEIDNE